MITPELKNYIQEQMKLGLSADDIKKTLLQSGWPQADVDAAMNEAKTIPAAAASSPTVNLQASPAVSKPSSIGGVDMISKNNNSEPMFKPSSSTPSAVNIFETKKEIKKEMDYEKFLLPGILGLVIIILVVAVGFVYAQKSSLSGKLSSANSQVSSLTNEVAALNKDKSDLQSQTDSLNKNISDLNSVLSLFVLSPGVSSSTLLSVDLKGVLNVSGKLVKTYSLADDRGFSIIVKNSTDQAVSAALKDSVGKNIELGGTHLPGSNYVDVNAVNGQAISSATSTAVNVSSSKQ